VEFCEINTHACYEQNISIFNHFIENPINENVGKWKTYNIIHINHSMEEKNVK